MKLFSWSSLFFILSLSFLWGCGYWVWLQTNQSQQTQLTSQLNLQLERSEVLLEDWQRNYRLHLDYLRADLAKMTPPSTDNVMYEPWAELDDKIQHAPWPDALLGYALLDESGRAVRLSNSVAGQLFAITNTDFSSNHQFLTPMVLPAQWVAPVHLELNSQHLLFWFDLAALKQKLLKAQQQAAGEILLVSATAQLVSPSRYQQTLLARFGLADLRDDQSLKFQLKRPPEDLTRSHQRYDGSMAWPATPLAQAMTATKQGQTALFVPNYLGRPSVASWRWSDGWQAYLVAERDLSGLQQQRKQLRHYLLAGLSALSAMFLVLFWLIQRGIRQQEAAVALIQLPASEQPVVISAATEGAAATRTESTQIPPEFEQATIPHDYQLKTARNLLQAWLCQPGAEHSLKEISLRWLSQTDQSVRVACQPVGFISALLTKIQKETNKELLFEVAADVPAWAELDISAVAASLGWVIRSRVPHHDVTTLMVKLVVLEPQQLMIEIFDDGESLGAGQWMNLLHQSQESSNWPAELQQLKSAGGHLSAAQQQFSGNKLLLVLPMQELTAGCERDELQLVDGSALLLCPAGDAQQLYRRMLNQTGLGLMPLDDAAQFMQWCSAQSDARLDYLILDEVFINGDQQIAAQVFQIVRRYFPQLALIVLVRQPAQWYELQQRFGLRLVSKPVLRSELQQALLCQEPATLEPALRPVWFDSTLAINDWLLRHQLEQLGYLPLQLQPDMPLPKDALLMLALENNIDAAKSELPLLLWYTAEDISLQAQDITQPVWTFDQGPVVLSRHLFQLATRLTTNEH